MVLLLGGYSTGKTSFIKFLIGRDFPGGRIGPEPVTDGFRAVMFGEDRIIPGNAVCVSNDKPFQTLQSFGSQFLNKFECSLCPAEYLRKVTLIDTPGILAGREKEVSRQYDFTA